jgi:methyl-accepting chemotaxis protein
MHEKRKQVIIKNEFQYRHILGTLLITLITLNVIIISAFLFENMFGSRDLPFSVFNTSVVAMEIVAVVIVYYIGRRISFRIAGPVFAMERTLKSMNEGDLALTLRLRAGDQFFEVADVINEVIGNYRERLAEAQNILASNDPLTPEQVAALREQLRWFITEKVDAESDHSG